MIATVASDELQLTTEVTSCVLPSVNVPVAVNCCVMPSGIVDAGGLIAIDTSAAAVTVSCVELFTLPDVAVIVAVPRPVLFASPVLLIVAAVGVSDVHVTVLVRSCVPPSVNVPVAVNCCVVPSASVGAAGVTAIDTRAAQVTFGDLAPATAPTLSVIAALPCPTPLAFPGDPTAVLIVATVG